MKIDGACHCGFITIEGEADPEKVTICHCTDCQTSTGTAFRISVPVPGASFKMTGQPTTYLKTTADSGNPRLQAFCPGRLAAPARQAAAEAAELVAFGATLGHRARASAEIREAKLMRTWRLSV